MSRYLVTEALHLDALKTEVESNQYKNMDKRILAIVAAVLFLLVVLGIVLYTFRKWFLLKQRKRRLFHASSKMCEMKTKKSKIRKNAVVPNFDIPMSYRAIKAQTPFISNTYNNTINNDDLKNEDHTRMRKNSLSQRLSLGVVDEEYLTKVASQFQKTRRKISQTAFEQSLRDRRSSSDSFQTSFDDDSFVDCSTPDTTGNLNPVELYEEPTVGAVRKRRLTHTRRKNSMGRKYRKVGKIVFTTKYTEHDASLEIHLIRAYDLVPKRANDELNLFCRMYLVPFKQQKFNICFLKGTRKPLDERMTFNSITKKDLENLRVKMKLYNHQRLKKNELIGEVDFALRLIDPLALETFDVPLFLQRSETSLAELKVALCHQATVNNLQVIIKGARRLPKVGLKGSPNTCVSVTFYTEHGSVKRNTDIVRNTQNPQFNTTFDFEVHTDTQYPLTTNTLVVTVHHLGILGQEDILGHVIFSHQSPQKNAKMHWEKVQNYPHFEHEESFFLLEPGILSEYVK